MKVQALKLCKIFFSIILLIFALGVPFAVSQEYFTPTQLSFTVYSDGFSVVDYEGDVDPTRSRVNITLFGSLYLDVLVWDQDGFPLDYSVADGLISVDTLGSISVRVSYVTPDLTAKDGQIWTFSISTSLPPVIVLPSGSTIVSLSSVPLSMTGLDGNLVITMPAGDIEISYTIGVVGTREHALAVINDAEETIQAIQAKGIVTGEADDLLQQAKEALEAEQYAEAEQLAEEAKETAQETESQALIAETAIALAGDAITVAEEAGNTLGLDQAKELLSQAEGAYNAGDYYEAETLALQAQTAAAEAKKPEKGLPLFWLGAAALFVAAAFLAFLFLRKPSFVPSAEPASYDMELLFEENPHLRLDDKEVLRFIAESGGEAFAAEIRDRFDVPRTSLWRMIRRLEREEVVEVTTIGGQSLVKISKKYRIGVSEG